MRQGVAPQCRVLTLASPRYSRSGLLPDLRISVNFALQVGVNLGLLAFSLSLTRTTRQKAAPRLFHLRTCA